MMDLSSLRILEIYPRLNDQNPFALARFRHTTKKHPMWPYDVDVDVSDVDFEKVQ